MPIGLLLVPLVLARVPESFGPDSGLDIRGLALVTGGVFGLVWGLVRGNIAGWGSLEVVGSLAAGALLLVAFVAWELRAPRADAARCASSARARSRPATRRSSSPSASLFCGVFFLAQFMQTGSATGRSTPGCGCCRGPRRCSSWRRWRATLVDRFGERPFMVVGPLLQAVGMGWIALIADAGMAYSEMIPPLIVAGIGVSMSFPAAQNSVVGSVPPEAIGKAAGTNSTMRELGGVFGIALSVAVFAGAGSYASAEAFSDGFVPAMTVSAGLSFLGALAGAALPARSGKPLSVPAGVTPVTEGEG